ncbi:MAG: YafY family protein [Desulfobacteraceae bacterium]|jgi:predicted DNA-binding transcriptional regulator YafY
MNRIDRLTAILIQLQTKRIVGGKEIAQRFGISIRTVYRDIRALEDAGVPIGAEAGLGYFLAEGFHLPPVVFTRDEAAALMLGGKLIEKYSDQAVNRHFSMALDKIKAVLDKREKEHIDTLTSYIEVLKTAPGGQGGFPSNLLPEIQSVLAQHRLVCIRYTSGYKEETTTRTIEPLGLCFYGAHWHLLAYCQLRRDYRDFRVDRIETIRHLKDTFDRHRHGSLKEIIRRIVYATDPKPACVRFERRTAAFVRDQKHFFGFVEERTDGHWIEMDFLTVSYDYLARWLLTFTDSVTVVSPEPLKERLREHCRILIDHHQEDD